ncbi:MAG: argininosuccinate synthase [Methanomassiliicoccaceae archaeon]|nr:argininosuccinate synthase [Methanomassiliicoccaceae archaeon]
MNTGKKTSGNREKVVLAYSGGLDTSVAIRWLQEKYDLDVIAVAVNVGQPDSKDDIISRAKTIGAIKAEYVDAREEFVTDYIWPSLKANAMYQGVYPLSTAVARPVIIKKLVEIAREEGAKYIAHGCTAKGNDQVRFDVGIMSLGPELKIIAPMRDWVMTREEAVEYARANNLPIALKKKSPYSIDENLWGRSCECGPLEDPWMEPPEDSCDWTTPPEDAPNEPEYLEIMFEKGIPVGYNGERKDGVTLITELNRIASRHGIGRIDHIEDRLIGVKSRETYECPAAILLIAAHRDMEFLTVQKNVLEFKRGVEQKYSELVYNGLWFGALRESLDRFVDDTQKFVTGTVRMKLFKGSAAAIGRRSDYSLYEEGLSTYSKGDCFDHASAVGFIYCWGLPDKTAAKAHMKSKK